MNELVTTIYRHYLFFVFLNFWWFHEKKSKCNCYYSLWYIIRTTFIYTMFHNNNTKKKLFTLSIPELWTTKYEYEVKGNVHDFWCLSIIKWLISAVKWINNKLFKYKTIKDAESDKITLEVNPKIQYTPSLFWRNVPTTTRETTEVTKLNIIQYAHLIKQYTRQLTQFI